LNDLKEWTYGFQEKSVPGRGPSRTNFWRTFSRQRYPGVVEEDWLERTDLVGECWEIICRRRKKVKVSCGMRETAEGQFIEGLHTIIRN